MSSFFVNHVQLKQTGRYYNYDYTDINYNYENPYSPYNQIYVKTYYLYTFIHKDNTNDVVISELLMHGFHASCLSSASVYLSDKVV